MLTAKNYYKYITTEIQRYTYRNLENTQFFHAINNIFNFYF